MELVCTDTHQVWGEYFIIQMIFSKKKIIIKQLLNNIEPKAEADNINWGRLWYHYKLFVTQSKLELFLAIDLDISTNL